MKFFAKHIFGVAQELRRLMDANLKREGLTPAQIHLLGYLAYKERREEKCIQRELCTACGDIRASSITSLIKGLETSGYICREQGEDARKKYVALTPHGAQVAENCRRFMDKVESQCVLGMSEQEAAAFVAQLDAIKSNLEKMQLGEGHS